MIISEQIIRIREITAQHCRQLDKPYPTLTLFFSVSNTKERAKVTHVSADSFDQAWSQGIAKLRKLLDRHKLKQGWLRVDWVTHIEALTWEELNKQLQDTKRNYFRKGLAFDSALNLAFLEQELNANAMLYVGGDEANVQLNEKNFIRYATSRYGKKNSVDFSLQAPVYVFSTQGAFCDTSGTCHLLAGSGLDSGRRILPPLDTHQVTHLIETSSQYLAGQVKKSGEFFYGWHPCFDRKIPTYNTLRHVSSTYAMIEAWEVSGDKILKAAIERSITHFTQVLIKTYTLPTGETAAYLTDLNDEIKLGGNAVCLLALVKYSEVTGNRDYLELLAQLALGIVAMQDAATGRFDHVLNTADLSLKEAFRIIYYDGEAAFGLMRLYGLTQDPRWLGAVEKAFDYFIANKHWKAHDHWLSYCVNELTRYKPEEKYFRFGIQNIKDHLDFVLERVTTFPTLLELMMAAEQMLVRLKDMPDMQSVLQELDIDKFYRALDYRAHYLLNGYFWPEMAMYFQNPARIVGSFFIRHHGFRVRIDDVEHYLSGFVAYRKMLGRKPQRTGSLDSNLKTPPVKIDNERYLELYKTTLSNKKDDYKKLDWLSERQMLCRFEMADKVIDFSKVNSWIDLGCGTGDFFHYILGKHTIGTVVGLDATDKFIDISKQKNKAYPIDYVIDNLMTYKDTHTYDLVTLSGILQLLDFEKIETVFSILTSLVKPGGQLWIDTLSYDYENTRRKNSVWRFKCTELIHWLSQCHFSKITGHAFNEQTELVNSQDSFLLYLYGINEQPVINMSESDSSQSRINTQINLVESPPKIKIPPALQDLKLIKLADQRRFLQAAEAGGQNSWLYFFPFLYCFSKARTQTLLWEQIDYSICLYLLREDEEGFNLRLYLPPFPFNQHALRVATDRLKQFNRDHSSSILWLEERQKNDIQQYGYRLKLVEEEYVYDNSLVTAASGKAFERLRSKVNRISKIPNLDIRPYRPEDQADCLSLLQHWRTTVESEKGLKIGGYNYARNLLNYATGFDEDILKAQVIAIDGAIRAFTFGGKITSEYGSLFITISDHAIEGLGYVQRKAFMEAHPYLPFFNDSSDADREGLAYLKNAFKPVIKNKLYRTRR